MDGLDIKSDNTEQWKQMLQDKILVALEKVGLIAEGYAKTKCPVDTGILRNSITHAVDPGDKAVYIGTNVEYAAYVELGTGEFYPNGGRKGGWAYVDSEGKGHFTYGMKPRPYLKPAAAEHTKEYDEILKSALKSG